MQVSNLSNKSCRCTLYLSVVRALRLVNLEGRFLHCQEPMKDHVEIDHLTKDDAFRVNRDQVMGLEIRFKIDTNVSNFETASPKTI